MWTLPVLVAVGVFMARAQLSTDTVWSYATGAAASAPVLMAPLGAGIAAWAGGRSQRRGTRYAWLLAGRDPAQAPLVEAGVLVACAVTAYGLVTAATLLPTATSATWGGPFWWWLASAGMGFTAVIAVAYAVGVLLPGRFTPFVAALVTYLSTILNLGQSGTTYALFPITVEIVLPFNTPHTPTMRGQILWFTGLGLLALTLVAIKVRSPARSVIPAAALSAALVVAGTATVIGENGRFTTLNRHITWSCVGSSPEVCVHPAFTSSISAIRQRAQAIGQRLESTPFAITRVEHRPRGVGGQPTPGAIAFALDAPSPDHYDRAGIDIAIAALGADSCAVGRETSGHAMAQLLVAWAAGNESLFIPRGTAQQHAKNRFLRLPLTAQQQWLTVHADAVRQCSVTPGAFT
ncbi:hypothetical protein O7543_10195 [Solwaraspora sp. WMMA2080]|uniref:hypothetical protein n=1 Tax=unclassified Solwaraspora TaxID=2627926 RepID=UPI00248CBCDA|nr:MULTISPECIES: hypothetical protein [unclassified Solwaraspora]WBB98677.1 hypothetical protein O7553_07170 [Solwaraspora sp. WMMA2059]WBC22770.1 hypothetical protein O7543_10195 [Solwaraspora sp. WMMA2080]